jgi:hypothetical protein
MKLKSFCTAKETVTSQKRQSTELETIFAVYTSDEELTRIYRKLKKPTSQRISNPLNTWANEQTENSQKKYKWPINT